jgi:hypothetical protein
MSAGGGMATGEQGMDEAIHRSRWWLRTMKRVLLWPVERRRLRAERRLRREREFWLAIAQTSRPDE